MAALPLRQLEQLLLERQQLQGELELLCERHSGVVDVPQLSVHVLEAKAEKKVTSRKQVRLIVEGWQLDTRQRQVEGYCSLLTWNESFLVPLRSPKALLTVQVLSKDETILKVQGAVEIQLKSYYDQTRRETWYAIGPTQVRLAIRVLHSRAIYYATTLKKVLASIAQIERLIRKAKSETLVDMKIAKLEHELDPSVPELAPSKLIWEDWLKDKVGERLMRKLLQSKLKRALVKRCLRIGLDVTIKQTSLYKSKALSRLSLVRQAKPDPLQEIVSRVTDRADTQLASHPNTVGSADSDIFYDSLDASDIGEQGVQYIEDTPYAQYSRRAHISRS
jgi:hypothetical protein